MSKPLRLLGNARRLLDTVVEEGPLTTARLAESLDMPRSTVIRLAEGLAAVNLMKFRPNGTVDLSSRWLTLADIACESRTEWAPARALLRELAQATGCTGVLCVYEAGAAMCLDWVPGKDNEVLQAKPGRPMPLHAGSEGRAILSGLSDEALEKVLIDAPFEAYTASTMITAEELRGDVARSRRQGYTVSLDDMGPGLGSVGVLVQEPERGQLGAIAMASLSDEILRRSDELAQILTDAVAAYPGSVVDDESA